MMWDYSAYKPAVTSTATAGWTEFMITTQAGNFSPPVAFYFDNIRFTTPVVGVPGDYNNDTVVDAADYTVWCNNLGAANETSLNGNGDGLNGVDQGDYDRWKLHFGEGAMGSGGAALAGGTAVPEPATWLLVSLATATSVLCRPPRALTDNGDGRGRSLRLRVA